MTKCDLDHNDGTVYEYPSIEDDLARADDEFSFNEDKYMELWREHLEERDGNV